jgi:hypothetical protein
VKKAFFGLGLFPLSNVGLTILCLTGRLRTEAVSSGRRCWGVHKVCEWSSARCAPMLLSEDRWRVCCICVTCGVVSVASWTRVLLYKGVDVRAVAGGIVQSMDAVQKAQSECRETNGRQSAGWLVEEGSGEGSALQSHVVEVAGTTSDNGDDAPEHGQWTSIHFAKTVARASARPTVIRGREVWGLRAIMRAWSSLLCVVCGAWCVVQRSGGHQCDESMSRNDGVDAVIPATACSRSRSRCWCWCWS